MDASPHDLEVAKAAIPVQLNPNPASQSEIDNLRSLVVDPENPSVTVSATLTASLTTNVKQWQPQWVQYDEFYRPVILNPYPSPLKVVYVYEGAPRVLVIPPLASAITELAVAGVYNFTAMVLNTVGAATNLAVGSMTGGGYVPASGQPPPPPPPPVQTYNDVPVQVKYSNATYQPFVVHQIIDAGMDPVVGEQKVLLDGVTPAWGAWVTNENGQRQFEIHKTQQFPGMDDPGEGALPGDYQLQLASASKPAHSGLSTKDLVLVGAAALVLLVGLGAIVFNVIPGRRQPRH